MRGVEAVRRLRGDGWFADVPGALAGALAPPLAFDMAPAAGAAPAPAGALLLRGDVLYARDGWVVASCGGLLAGRAAGAAAAPAPGDAVHVTLRSARAAA